MFQFIGGLSLIIKRLSFSSIGASSSRDMEH